MNGIEYIVSIIKLMLHNAIKVVTGNADGNINLSSTSATAGSWAAVQMISNNVAIASITIDGAVYTGWSGITQAQGSVIYGNITSITLSAGTVRLYGNIKMTV